MYKYQDVVCKPCYGPMRNKTIFSDTRTAFPSSKRDFFFCFGFNGCTFSCRDSQELREHKLTHTMLQCPHDNCEYVTFYKRSLTSHLNNIHKKAYKCYICYQNFLLSKELRQHYKDIHEESKPYNCKFCSYSCYTFSNMITHERKHTEEKPFECEFCFRRFNQGSALSYHKKSFHGLVAEKDVWRCDRCPYKAFSKYTFETHMRIHTGELPFACDFCDRRFAQKNQFVVHRRMIHTGERPYKCSECEYAAAVPAQVRNHYKTNHSTEGIQKGKKKEERVSKLLHENGIAYDREVSIDFSCFSTEGKRSRVDFVIYREVDPGKIRCILLECDEFEHNWYETSCETRRMMDTFSAIAGKFTEIMFIRYNPDSFAVDGIKQKIDRKTRETNLVDTILNYKQTYPFEVVYLNYTTIDGKPVFYIEDSFKDFLEISTFISASP